MRALKSLFNVDRTESKFYWLIWLATFISCFGKFIFGLDVIGDFLLTGVMCLVILISVTLDRRFLKRNYFRPPSLGWVLITPVYLFRRDFYTNKPDSRLSIAYLFMVFLGLGTNVYLNNQAGRELREQTCVAINALGLSGTYNFQCLKVINLYPIGGNVYKGDVINNLDLKGVRVTIDVAESGLISHIELSGDQ